MAQPYVGEIRMFAGNFAPAGWMFCEGQLLPISEYETLFNLIGTTYGGDGQSTFALPDLRGRLPIHQGNGFILAETGGAEEITLTVNQIPAHSHPLLASTDLGNSADPGGAVLAQSTTAAVDLYLEDTPTVSLAANAVVPVGGSQPHDNFQPYLCVDFIISLFGIFPTHIGGMTWILLSPRSASSPSTSRRKGWAWCDGQLLPLSQNTALFSLLGTTYGGDGKSNFALPDLQGSAPMHPGQGPGLSLYDLGETGGSDTISLLESEIPSHPHAFRANNTLGDNPGPTDHALARYANAYQQTTNANLVAMNDECAAPGGRRPTAQQPATLPDVLLQHRLARGLPPRT